MAPGILIWTRFEVLEVVGRHLGLKREGRGPVGAAHTCAGSGLQAASEKAPPSTSCGPKTSRAARDPAATNN